MRPCVAALVLFGLPIWAQCSNTSHTPGPIVTLPYGRYQGLHNETSELNVFLGIRYAQAPVGDLRWREPKAPTPINGTTQATSQPEKCFQLNLLGDAEGTPGVPKSSEDCLFLSVFAPPSDSGKKLPVLLWVHGGGYFAGYAAAFDPTTMLRASNNSFVAVIIQYRLGMFGFLAGAEVKKDGALNAGLLDVQFALQWVQKNIHLFGGDPDKVTLWGESAGAGAVAMQVVAHGGRTEPALFRRSIASSPYVPPNYRYDDPHTELQYKAFVEAAGCTGDENPLACLRSLNSEDLADAATQLPVNLLPAPVVDGSFLIERPQLSLTKQQVNGETIMSLHNLDEGRIFVVRDSNSTVVSFIKNMFPNLSPQQASEVADAYGVFATSNASDADNIYKIQTMVFGEAEFTCPSLWLVNAFPNKGHLGLFAAPPSLHGLDLNVYFPGSYSIQPTQPFSQSYIQSFMGSLLSFILEGHPNRNPMNATINPDWPIYDSQKPEIMTFGLTGSGAADPNMQIVDPELIKRCNLWGSLAPNTPQ